MPFIFHVSNLTAIGMGGGIQSGLLALSIELEYRLRVSSGPYFVIDLITRWVASANLAFPAAERCSPSRAQSDMSILPWFTTCNLADFVHLCRMNILIFSIFWFKLISSNLNGISLTMICALLFNVFVSSMRLLISVMHVATVSRGPLFVPPRSTTISSCFEIIPGRQSRICSAVNPGSG